ncbi:type II secretion system F family protein [Paraburkholderia sp. DHOC27]|uniref:type II secretion system F family protein n=1 Tax=Paraburkholderia sp. DHOC27 TaxID=2303330 RepID=UPI000E3BBEE3|nr:type II secretion system F family protein [Paraburkholderia sp. DHOC27]RFU47976.1 type II secretion protein F [Paraburkholderia sp. DHOC27]
MSSFVLIFAALALLCAAGALLILQRGAQRKEQASTARFIDSRMAPAVAAGLDGARGAFGGNAAAHGGGHTAARTAGLAFGGAAGGSGAAGGAAGNAAGGTRQTAGARAPAAQLQTSVQAPQAGASWRELARYQVARCFLALDHIMNRAGITNARTLVAIAGGFTAVLCLWAGREGGWPAAGVTLLACACTVYFVLSTRTNKRRMMIVRQLPSFLDGIVRLIVLGNSVPAAFQGALQTTEAPLRTCLDQVSRLLRSGVEIDRALSQAAMLYGANELELVGAVLRLSVKYGGRADVMLDRMSTFMRDLEQAERELSAMSAETRMSAVVLALLPVGIGGFLILTNPRYFGAMWFDPNGRKLVYLAFALQLVGAWLLHRLTRLKRS